MQRLPSLLVTLALAGAAPAQDGAPPAAELEPLRLRFGWPERGRVKLAVEVDGTSETGRTTCVLAWAPAPPSEAADAEPEWIVRFEDLDFREPDGGPRGARSAALAPAAPFRVTPDGEFVGLVEADGTAAAASLGLEPGGELATLLADPVARATIENAAAEDWSWWASFWDGFETRAGEEVASDVTLPTSTAGNPVRAELTLGCVDVLERGGEPAARLRARTVYDPAELRRATLAMLRKTSEREVRDGAVVAVSRVDEVDGIYALDGLRPLEVRWKRTITVDDGAGPRETVERKSWTFDWSG